MRTWLFGLAILAAPLAPATAQEKSGVPADIAAKLREIGPVVNPPPVYKLYEPLLARQPKDGVKRSNDLAYGPDDRNKLDVYEPEARASGKLPVVIFLHGGGFVRGDKADRANLGYFFARNGVVAMLASYRLAPKNVWPSGAEDVGRMVAWAKANAAAHGGDPDHIFLICESAGAAHVSSAILRKSLQPAGGLGISGAVLISGVYDVDLETRARAQFDIATPDPRNDAYFGTDAATFRDKSTALNVDAPKIPLLMTYAALDPAQMQMQAGELFATLCRVWNECPQLKWFADHDHISTISSFNTADTSVSGPILDFIRKH